MHSPRNAVDKDLSPWNGPVKDPNVESATGWCPVPGADGKPYYYNKKTGECSWTPPPPPAAGEAGERRGMSDTVDKAKDGWRRTKQSMAAKVFSAVASSATTDEEVNAQHASLLQLEAQMLSIKSAMEAHTAAM